MNTEKKQVHAFLKGKVQGVGMRAYVSSIARKLKLCGFVRNLDDGKVEILAQGEEEILEKFLQTLKEGPYASYIWQIDLSWETPIRFYDSFEITS
jgi:acylphosphatase